MFGGPKRLEKDRVCPKCGKKGVWYLSTDVLHGNPYTPASDTEVEHHYRCDHCDHAFSRVC